MKCQICGSETKQFLDLGEHPPCDFWDESEIDQEIAYPLTVHFCSWCSLVQLGEMVKQEALFTPECGYHHIAALSSSFLKHLDVLASRTVERFQLTENDLMIEIGSNDGALLEAFQKQGVKVLGVDPTDVTGIADAKKLVTISKFFDKDVAKEIGREHGKAKVITALNTFAHVSGLDSVVEGIEGLLTADGVFISENHYVLDLIKELQYDFIYHEHIYYYSLLALGNHLARHGMVIFDIKPIPIHGGSIRYYAAKKNSKHAKNISQAVNDLRAQEKQLGYDKEETYKQFAKRVAGKKDELMTLLAKLKIEGKRVVGYGASGRANTIIQYCGITTEHIDYMIDDAPAKLGMYTPGSHLEIKNSEALKTDKPDYILVFAWAFYNEIAKKNQQYLKDGGQMIVPLPDVKITSEVKE